MGMGMSLGVWAEVERTCDRCGMVGPGIDFRLTPIGHHIAGLPEIGMLCASCAAEICWQCEDAMMVQEQPGWQWACPKCGNVCPPDVMLFFKGEATLTFPAESKE